MELFQTHYFSMQLLWTLSKRGDQTCTSKLSFLIDSRLSYHEINGSGILHIPILLIMCTNRIFFICCITVLHVVYPVIACTSIV